MSTQAGGLYVVATPIGNLGDISARALEVLGMVDRVLAEDTRRTRALLSHHGISRPLEAVHEHNEAARAQSLVRRLLEGESMALVSDAGTPLISDPGVVLVREAIAAGVRVVPVPGASAAISALSVSGLPTDRFVFEGFLPAKGAARTARLRELAAEPRTLVFYEAPHRVLATLQDMAEVFGAGREAVLARELTKIHETVLRATLEELAVLVREDPDQQRGEVVLVVAGSSATADERTGVEVDRVLETLLDVLPASSAAAVAARLLGGRRNELYKRAMELRPAARE